MVSFASRKYKKFTFRTNKSFMSSAIKFENIGKQYRLGLVSTGTIAHDLNRWWTMNILRKEDPYLKIGETNDRSQKGHSDYVWALKDINFSVEEGDVVGIIGKNGAGKSTLLKLLSRVTTPTTGIIRSRGRIASLLEVGTGFHPEMTGRENIYLNGAILGMTKVEITRKLDEIVDFSGCERYIDTPVKRYSSGMTVRLGFAIAAHLDPEILVVDEVLAVGDAEFQKKAIGKMQDVSKGQGRTVLFVSHNMGAVRRLCHHGIVLKNGQIDYMGDVNSSVDYYLQDQTASIAKSVVIQNKHRNKSILLPELEIKAVSFYDDPAELSTDEPIRLQFQIHRNNKDISNAYFAVIFNDALSETRLINYYTEIVTLPAGKDDFCVDIELRNHHLNKRLFSINVEASTFIDYVGAKVMDQCFNVLTCEIKYISRKENKVWNESWGLMTLKGSENTSVHLY